MAVLGSDLTGFSVLIYDTNGNHLGSTVIASHDRKAQWIQVKRTPSELRANDNCKLLVLSSPSPCEYQGKVKREGKEFYIAIFQGQEKESRGATRYKVNTPAVIDSLIYDKQPYPLHTPVTVELMNISTSGVRFRAPFYSFTEGNTFQMHFVISGSQKMLIAIAVNHTDKEPALSEYGCRFL